MPPLTCIVSPVIYDPESEDKKATVFDTSSPVPSRDIGIFENGYLIYGIDNLITGSLNNINHLKTNNNFEFIEHDVTKFIDGNNSAGTRVRKAMQTIKSLAQEVRVEVQDQKNAQF